MSLSQRQQSRQEKAARTLISKFLLIVSSIVGVLLLADLVGFAGSAGATTWPTPYFPTAPTSISAANSGDYLQLYGISCWSYGNCIAVGESAPVDPLSSNSSPVYVAETNGQWDTHPTPISVPDPSNVPMSNFDSVSCWSAGNCVAVGSYVDSSSHPQLIYDFSVNGRWAATATVASPPTGWTNSYPTGVSCDPTGHCTTVGYGVPTGASHDQSFYAQSSGTTFDAAVELPSLGTSNNLVDAVSCLSAITCVAAGSSDSTSTATTYSETNGVWSVTPVNFGVSGSTYQRLLGISCLSSTDCVAVGGYVLNSYGYDVYATLSGTTWTTTTLPAPWTGGALNAVSCTSPGNCMAVGYYYDPNSYNANIVVQESNGVWTTPVTLPVAPSHANGDYFNGVSCSTAGSCAMAGYATDLSNVGLLASSLGQLTLTTSTIPSGTVGVAYNAALSAQGGTGSYSFAVTSGSLPPGISLDPSTGLLSGVPTTAGSATFTISVTDTSTPNQSASMAFTLSLATGAAKQTLAATGTEVIVPMELSALLIGSGFAFVGSTIVVHRRRRRPAKQASSR